MYSYKAEYEDDNIEIILASSDEEGINEAMNLEEQHGALFNLTLLDANYNELKTVF